MVRYEDRIAADFLTGWKYTTVPETKFGALLFDITILALQRYPQLEAIYNEFVKAEGSQYDKLVSLSSSVCGKDQNWGRLTILFAFSTKFESSKCIQDWLSLVLSMNKHVWERHYSEYQQ